MTDNGAQPLASLAAGASGVVVDMAGGHAFQDRLMSMGLLLGSTVRVVRAGGRGPTLVAVGETRLAVGRGMSEKVMVQPLAGQQPAEEAG